MKIVSTEVLYRGKLTAERDTLEHDGRFYKHETIRHPGAVVILPIDDSGNLILVRQYRHSVGQVLLEVPAGTLEEGEAPEVTAIRELREEIGMGANILQSLGTIFPAPGFCDEKQFFYLARELYPDPAKPDDDEKIEIVHMSPIDVDEAVRNGALCDGKSLAILLKAKLMMTGAGSKS